MDVIYNLINVKKFYQYTFEEKIRLKENGRPLPDISIETESCSRGKAYKRQFNRDIYARNNWICGCNEKNALFCFPCVLFGGDKSWAQSGITDLTHLSDKIKKHELSKKHLHNQMEFALLGSVKIEEELNSEYWIDIQKFNEIVTKNRYVLSKIIDCIKFCGVFKLGLGEHDERENSNNPGIFRGLLNFSAQFDKTLSEHLENSSVFEGLSNDILECMLEVCQENIIDEINKSPYLAIMVDEIADVSEKSQMVTIFRYCLNGVPIERFWTYLTPSKLDTESLTVDILDILNPILENSKDKLIAQSYNGAEIMSAHYNGVQARIKEIYPYAHFIHCYAHHLNSIISKACSENFYIRLFFGNLKEIPRFFKNSPQRVAVLDKIVKRKFPRNAPTCWNFNSRTICVINEYREEFIECMEEIEDTFNNPNVCSAASSIRRILLDSEFIFWLTFFNYVTPHIDILSNILQKRETDILEIDQQITDFEENIMSSRKQIDHILSEASTLETTPIPNKRQRTDNNTSPDYRKTAIEVCDIIINCVKDRFSFKNHLLTASLLYSEQFGTYSGAFPDDILNLTCCTFPSLDRERLKTELSVIYSRIDCRNISGVIPFLKFLIKNNLAEVFQQTKKLLEILLTMPIITSETERCFSSLNRIKTFLRTCMIEESFVALSMLSVEKEMINSIPNFNEKVIDKFAAKDGNRKINLIYKKTKI